MDTIIKGTHDTLQTISIISNPNANDAFKNAQINIESPNLQVVNFEAKDSSLTYESFFSSSSSPQTVVHTSTMSLLPRCEKKKEYSKTAHH